MANKLILTLAEAEAAAAGKAVCLAVMSVYDHFIAINHTI